MKHDIFSHICLIRFIFANTTATNKESVPGPKLECLKNGSFLK